MTSPSITREEYRKAKNKRKKRLRPWAFYTFLIIFLSILTYSIYQVYTWSLDNKHTKELTKELADDIKPIKNDSEGELVNPPKEDDKENDYWYYTSLPFYEVDFTKLKEKNSDTIAFIHMFETNINYPVVQTNNNEYYLSRSYDKTKNAAGWVFMDYRNNIDNLSDNTVIYGHGRLDKTVFGSLKNALNKSWQNNKDNYIIWLSTEKENMMFQIFSIYTIEKESYYIETNFKTTKDKETWLNTMQSRNQGIKTTTVSTSDKILTLSTCENAYGGRIVVQAKLIKRQAKE